MISILDRKLKAKFLTDAKMLNERPKRDDLKTLMPKIQRRISDEDRTKQSEGGTESQLLSQKFSVRRHRTSVRLKIADEP